MTNNAPGSTPCRLPAGVKKTGLLTATGYRACPQLGEHAAAGHEFAFAELLTAQLGKLLQELFLCRVQLDRCLNVQVYLEIAAAVAPEVGDAQTAKRDDLAGLGASLDVDLTGPVEGFGLSSVPKAAAVMGTLSVACRSSPSRI